MTMPPHLQVYRSSRLYLALRVSFINEKSMEAFKSIPKAVAIFDHQFCLTQTHQEAFCQLFPFAAATVYDING